MRIAFDAKWLYSGNVSGKIVLRNLLINSKLNKKNKYYILVKKKELFQAKKEFGKKYNIIPINFILNNAFTNIFVIPFYIFIYRLDFIVLQSFGTFFYKSRIGIFVHDILYKDFPEFFSKKEKIYFSPIVYLLKKARIIFTTSDYVVKCIKRHTKYKQINIINTSLGVDHLKKIKSIQPKKIKNNLKYVLFVGRFNNRKNILNLVKAFNRLNYNNIKLVLVGKKSHKFDNINSYISQNQFKNKIIIIENASDNNIKWLYKNALIFCSPSYAEGFGLPPIEAMSQACSVIVSNTTAHPEICGSSALYFNPNDSVELSNKINLLIKNKKKRLKLTKMGKKRSKIYLWKQTSSKLLMGIENLLKKNNNKYDQF